METQFAEISIKGKFRTVPALRLDGHIIVADGGWLRIATIHDEHWQAAEVENPEAILAKLGERSLKADLFTFAQKLPHTEPRFHYALEWDNVAAVPITTYADWWEKRLPQETRKNVRRSIKRGVTTQAVMLDDAVALGLKKIYDESPIRQGRKFWHYGKDVATVKRENSSYLGSSAFIGAYFEGELIGLLKMVFVGKTASIMQIISANKHYDKRPPNALLAKAVETCVEKGMAYFVYGQYVYGNNNDGPLTEFKRRNGFEQILLPRYYVPMTTKGRIAMRLKLHLGLRRLLPRKVETTLQNWRCRLYEKTLAKQSKNETEPPAES
ncbi:MAG: hypothetical protein WAO02_01060 [Verrucomicrobiia bacterium]